eukprot:SAG11_NODE_23727_length_384_cov_0.543860_2_plen_50_part_01
MQIDIKSNTDKFYNMQVLTDAGEERFWCSQWWGRTGSVGQATTDGPFDSL